MSTEASIRSLPLFPLHNVLFPLSPLQLHVFEERYKVMINGCIERKEPFGVVLIREGDEVGQPALPFEIGCMAHILAVKRFEDDRMLLLAIGGNRFRLLDYVQTEQNYLVGKVEILEDEPCPVHPVQELHNELSGLFLHYLSLLTGREDLSDADVTLPDDPALMTFAVAAMSSWPLSVKQGLLESTNPLTRLQEEVVRLREDIREMEARRAQGEPAATVETVQLVLRVHPIGENDEERRRYLHLGRN